MSGIARFAATPSRLISAITAEHTIPIQRAGHSASLRKRLKLRTYFDKKDKITSKAQVIFLDSGICNTELLKSCFWLIDGVVIAEELADVIFAELAIGREIFQYDQSNYPGLSRYSWIRY